MKIPIVDENDIILYYKGPETRDKHTEITRITGVWIINEKKEALISLRSKNKKHHPNIWGPSVAGTVEEGETYKENALKEIEEEIGIKVGNVIPGPKERISSSHEFFCQWFFVKVPSNSKFTLQESEVDKVRWIELEELNEWFKKEPENFVPSIPSCIEVLKNYIYETQS